MKPLTTLEHLRLGSTNVGDGVSAIIAAFERLEVLELSGTKISDEGLSALTAVDELTHLDISRTRVTDAGLQQLAELEFLDALHVEIGGEVSSSGVEALKSKLPTVNTIERSARSHQNLPDLRSLFGRYSLALNLCQDSWAADERRWYRWRELPTGRRWFRRRSC